MAKYKSQLHKDTGRVAEYLHTTYRRHQSETNAMGIMAIVMTVFAVGDSAMYLYDVYQCSEFWLLTSWVASVIFVTFWLSARVQRNRLTAALREIMDCWTVETRELNPPKDHAAEQFVKDACRTESTKHAVTYHGWETRLLHVCFGIATECGEFTDILKRATFYGEPWDLEHMDEEVGDLLWYLAIYLDVREKSFAEVMAANTRKLRVRYPKKFTNENAVNRDLDDEQVALVSGDEDGIDSGT